MSGSGGEEAKDEMIEVGPVKEIDLGSLEFDRVDITEGPASKVARTQATLAYLLFGLLAAIVAILLGLLAAHRITAQEFDTVASVLIAPVVGLLGAATGYYYGKGDR